MRRLHRIHAGFIFGVSLLRTLGRIAFAFLLVAACIWLIQRSFTDRPAIVLIVCVVIWGIRKAIRIVGEFLGPPEPTVKEARLRQSRNISRQSNSR